MSIEGWYYLHTNGDLIYKPDSEGTAADIRDSDFARGLWPIDTTDRANAWQILVEAGASGANADRLTALANRWGCDDEDGKTYAEYVGADVRRDGNMWCATRKDFVNLQESPAGFGATIREAMSELAKTLGYRPAKMWGTSFDQLLKQKAAA